MTVLGAIRIGQMILTEKMNPMAQLRLIAYGLTSMPVTLLATLAGRQAYRSYILRIIMGDSETALLRREMAKMLAENRKLQDTVARMKAEHDRTRAGLEEQIDLLMETIAEQDRRLAKYENPNAPSSTDSMYNKERDAFRKRMAEEEGWGRDGGAEGGPEPEGRSAGGRRGPPLGHEGASHGNRPSRKVWLRLYRCRNCGRGHLAYVAPVTRIVNDFPGGDSRRIETVAYVLERGLCGRCDEVSTAPAPGLLPGTSFGRRALGFILEYYARRSTDATTSYYFEALYGFSVSENAVWNARRAMKDLLRDAYDGILERISRAAFVQFDESVIRMNGRRGYVWLATAGDAAYLVAAPSRAAAVLELHFRGLLGVPAVTDGYAAYGVLPVRQRCWVHLLREAEKYAVKNGGDDLSCYRRLLSMYRRIKNRGSADCAECLDLEKAVLRIALDYKKEHGFRATLENAAPHLFTFLRYPGMPPHNNAAELEIRDTVVLHRNVRHQLSEPEGRQVFSVLVSVARTCQKMGMFPRMAVERMIEDPDWRIFKPPDCPERAELSVQAAAAAPPAAATTATAAAC